MSSQAERTFDLPHSCPHCGYAMEAALNASNRRDVRAPQPGDIGICVDCGEWLIFTGEPGPQKKPSPIDQAAIELHPSSAGIKRAWQRIKEEGPPTRLGEPRPVMHKCPSCGTQHDFAAGAGNTDSELEPGTFALCVTCGEWMTITEGQPRKPTDSEYVDLAYSKHARTLRRAWVQMAADRDRKRAAESAERAKEKGNSEE